MNIDWDSANRTITEGYVLLYVYIKRKKHVKMEHRWIYEKVHGVIPPRMVIHHINGNKTDNRIENLLMLNNDMHRKVHCGFVLGADGWYKPCNRCKVLKRVESSYHKKKLANSEGYQSVCKECYITMRCAGMYRAKEKLYNDTHRDQRAEASKKHYNAHSKELKVCRELHRKEKALYDKQRYEKLKDKKLLNKTQTS